MKDTLKAILVDDEPDGRSLLRSLLEQYCPIIDIITECDSAFSGITAIQNSQPDVIFLDIQMPLMNGFSMLEKLGTIDFEIIFITSYDQYALRAFKYNALDYLLKPVDEKELIEAVDKCAVRCLSKKAEQKNTFVHNYTALSSSHQAILPVREGYMFVRVSDIVRCEADGNYTQVFMQNGDKYLVSKTLKEFEGQLVNLNFVRVHKSHLVNLQYIRKYIRGEGGTLVMTDHSEIEVSRRSKEAFLAIFNL